ncbi:MULTISPECIES: phage baseplate plug family protein [Pseudomonas]|uniref:phage baseplate plug family protein n=1 Tax=Pseudomonas TaxID=286 RepID=UPI00235DD14E|nr:MULTISPECIES: hypothetical protein [Pseudomonas]WJV25922.1 hypothetical protein PSR66_07805 [Pseudomonas chlororaphis]
MFTIPLAAGVDNSHQRFSVQLGESLIAFEIDFVSYLDAPAWSMNLSRGGVRLASGVMLEPGSDIIEVYRAGIGQMVFTGSDVTLDNLGIDNNLVWIPPVVEI